MPNFAHLKLGKHKPLPGLLIPKLSQYRLRVMPPPPVRCDYVTGIDFKMFCNDRLGCCTISAIANGIVQRTSLTQGAPVVMPDAVVEQCYSRVSGYDPARPDTDCGALESDVLAWFARDGVKLRDQSLETGSFASLHPHSPAELREAIWLFGSVYVGFALPTSAMDQAVWDVPAGGPVGEGEPGSWGGHATLLGGYDETTDLWAVVTWGGVQPATTAFIRAYLDEAYAIFSLGEWIGPSGLSPSHFDFEALQGDLREFAGGGA